MMSLYEGNSSGYVSRYYSVENGGLFCRSLSWYAEYDEESGEMLTDDNGDPLVTYYLGVRELGADEYEKYSSLCKGEKYFVLSSDYAKPGDSIPEFVEREELINNLNGKE